MTSASDVINEYDESFDLLIQVWMRFLIAFYSLLAFFLDHKEFGGVTGVVDKLLITYCLYSACLLFIYDMQKLRRMNSTYFTHWIDTLYFAVLVSLTGGAESLYFPFFFFPIMVASFSWGFKEGVKSIGVTIALFTIIIFGLYLAKIPFILGETLMRPLYLIVFGGMVAYWGGARIVLNRRLGLLRAISTNWNPRFGVDHAVQINLERLINFYEAERCVLVLEHLDGVARFLMYSVDRAAPAPLEEPKEIEPATARELLRIPRTIAFSYEIFSTRTLKSINKFISFDVTTLESSDRYLRESKTLSSLFDDKSLVSVPYKQQGVASGRLYLVAPAKEMNRSDVIFIKQVADAIATVVDNMELIENLIAEASGQERLRISLDVHDTTIQPYIGLTLALDALAIEFNTDKRLAASINEIVKMANMTILDLRSYKDTLREKSLMRGDVLLSSIKNQCDRLFRFYGISVDITGSVDPNLPGKIAEAAFQIVKEGLSNILRHTSAKHASIALSNTAEYISLEIANEVDPLFPDPIFSPKSIFERVKIFEGEMAIENTEDGYTVVKVKLPLSGNKS